MILTKEQFINQNAFWQDRYYSYAIHKTSGGALYLYRIEGTIINDKNLQNMQVFRLDGMDIDMLVSNIKKVEE